MPHQHGRSSTSPGPTAVGCGDLLDPDVVGVVEDGCSHVGRYLHRSYRSGHAMRVLGSGSGRTAPCPRDLPGGQPSRAARATSSSGCTDSSSSAPSVGRREDLQRGRQVLAAHVGEVVTIVISLITSGARRAPAAARAARPAGSCRRGAPARARAELAGRAAGLDHDVGAARADQLAQASVATSDADRDDVRRRRVARARSSRAPAKSTTVIVGIREGAQAGEDEGPDRAGADEHHAVAVAHPGAAGRVQPDRERLGQPGVVERAALRDRRRASTLGDRDELGHAAVGVQARACSSAGRGSCGPRGTGRTRRTRRRRPRRPGHRPRSAGRRPRARRSRRRTRGRAPSGPVAA